jgi:hypothetical protein
MTTTDQHGCHGPHADWEQVGRTAERFARRVADDAKHFAERVEEHVVCFARDLRREWGASPGASGSGGSGPGEDMRRIFDDVGAMVRGVVDGVAELISGLFKEAKGEWALVVLNRDATCGGCGKTAKTGSEAWVRRSAVGTEFRCGQCGVPGEKGTT